MTDISIYEKLVIDVEQRRIEILKSSDGSIIVAEINNVINICQIVPIRDIQKGFKLQQLRSEQRDANINRLRQLISDIENGRHVLYQGIINDISLTISELLSIITHFSMTDLNDIIARQNSRL